MPHHHRRFPALAVAAMLTATSAAGAQSFTGLGFLQDDTASYCNGLSNDGRVVVGYGSPGGHPFRWTLAGGFANSYANDANEDGTVVVGRSDSTPGPRGFYWTASSGVQSVGVLPGGMVSEANAVSADGSVIVGISVQNTSPTGFRAFRWTLTDGMADLGTLPGTGGSAAYAVSADGNVVVGVCESASGSRGFRWTAATGLQDIGDVPGFTVVVPMAVSDNGTVVFGFSSPPSGGGRAFRWTSAGGIQDIGTLPGGAYSRCLATNSDGSAAVGYGASTNGEHAIFWGGASGISDLNSYLPTLGISLSGWTLTHARGMSADGRVIAGTGIHNGVQEAWIAELRPRPCGLSDIASLGGGSQPDGQLTSDDVIIFLLSFFSAQPRADVAMLGGSPGGDGLYTADDIILFLAAFFTGCP